MINQVHDEFARLKAEHMHDRDGANNYSCFNVENCRNCNFSYNSRNCLSCHNCDSCIECVQCVDCKSCAFCVGLNGAKYMILNEQFSEQEYYRRLQELGIDPEVQAY